MTRVPAVTLLKAIIISTIITIITVITIIAFIANVPMITIMTIIIIADKLVGYHAEQRRCLLLVPGFAPYGNDKPKS